MLCGCVLLELLFLLLCLFFVDVYATFLYSNSENEGLVLKPICIVIHHISTVRCVISLHNESNIKIAVHYLADGHE